VDLETIAVWTDALYMETLATDRPMETMCMLWLWCCPCALLVCTVLLGCSQTLALCVSCRTLRITLIRCGVVFRTWTMSCWKLPRSKL
jgi:hypothetical protein